MGSESGWWPGLGKEVGVNLRTGSEPKVSPSLRPRGSGLAGVRPGRWRSTTVMAWPLESHSRELVAWLKPLLAAGPGQAFSP